MTWFDHWPPRSTWAERRARRRADRLVRQFEDAEFDHLIGIPGLILVVAALVLTAAAAIVALVWGLS